MVLLKIENWRIRTQYSVKNCFLLTESSSLQKFHIYGTYFNENMIGKQNCKHMSLNFGDTYKIDNHPNVLKNWNTDGAAEYTKFHIKI